MTSHDVVNRVRKLLRTRRVGHTGTLDPFATGVLVLLVGRATRLARFLDADEKEYDALLRIGFATDTGDRTGTKIENENIPDPLLLDHRTLLVAMLRFLGDIEQIPPMYSAKKIDGKKLYEHARRGETVEREPVKINVGQLALFEKADKWPGPPHDIVQGTRDFGMNVVCSAGTYVRTLGEDIAEAAGTRAHLAELDRMRAGRFTKEMAISLDELASMERPETALLPMEEAVAHLPLFDLRLDRVGPTRNGMPTWVEDGIDAETEYRMVAPGGELIAIGTVDTEKKEIRPIVVLG